MKKVFTALAILLLLCLGLYLVHPFILDRAAKFLVVSDKLEKADVILVLAGDVTGERMEEGIKLFKAGYSGRLLLSGGPLVWKLTSAEWMRKQALESGAPGNAILIQDRSRSTIEDARFCLPLLQEHKFRTVILVTSPYHTRRAARVFKKIYPPAGIRVMIVPARKSEFNPAGWWTRHEDSAFVVWEYVSLVVYFFKGY